MNIFKWLTGDIIGEVGNIIDDVVTTEEEKLERKNKWYEIQARIFGTALEAEKELVSAQRDVIVAEAKGASWLQRNWRPLLMLTIILIVFNNFILFPYAAALGLNVVVLELPAGLWALMTAGVSGYVVGRSAEKIIPNSVWSDKKDKD
jgi:hypothetical protein